MNLSDASQTDALHLMLFLFAFLLGVAWMASPTIHTEPRFVAFGTRHAFYAGIAFILEHACRTKTQPSSIFG